MSNSENSPPESSGPATPGDKGTPQATPDIQRALLASAHNAVIAADKQGLITIFNAAAERMTGYRAEELVGKQTPLIFHDMAELKKRAEEYTKRTGQPLDHPFELVLKMAREGTPGLQEWTLLRKDGSRFPALLSTVALRSDDGSVLGYVGIAADLSQQRQTERAWQEQSEFLQIVLDAIPSPIYFKDRRGAYLGCNTAFEEFCGRPRGEIVGKTEHDLFSKDLADLHHAADQRLFNKGGIQRYDSFAVAADGTPREVVLHKAVFERGQTITGLVGAILDITERKRAEKQLRDSEAKYRELVQSANSIILRMDRQGDVTFFNEYAQRFFGFSEREILGRNVVGTIVPETDTAGRDLRAMILDIGKNPECYATNENENIKRSGERVWIAWTNRAIHDAQGAVVEILCVGNDITKQKVAETQLQHAKEEAEAANRAKTTFLASMSHEIRTPMTAILGYADLLLHMSPSQRHYSRWVRDLRRNCDHLLALLNDVLDLSKIEAGQMELHIEDVRVSDLLDEIVALLRPHASEKGLSFDVQYHSRIPATCRTDALRLRQILLNLSTNAIKFTDKGGVTIEVSSKESEGVAHLLMGVKDTGIGIPEEQLDQLFKPFSQAHFSSRRQYGGTGLGLSISQRLANALGGLIYLESKPGEGSTFTLDLPVRQGQEIEWLETKEIRQATKTEPPKLSRLDGRRILLVEDGPDNQRILRYMLEGAGAEVVIAENGSVGVEAFRQAVADGKSVDLVLMDIQMPVMDGYEATRTLRAEGVTTPIVALTAFAMSGDRETCLAAGCNDYLPKPITTASLLNKLSQHLPPPAAPSAPAKKDQEEAPVRSRLADDPRFSSLVRDFQADLGQRIAKLETAREEGDDETIRTQAHRLKSAAGMLGFDGLSAAAAVCEQAWREERYDRNEMLARLLKWLRASHVGHDES